MEHTEGVLKKAELFGEGENACIMIEFIGYDSHIYKISIGAQDLINRILLNEKIGMVCYESSEIDDVVSIRGVAKNLLLIGKYSH